MTEIHVIAFVRNSKKAYISNRHVSSDVESWGKFDSFVDLYATEMAPELVIMCSLESLQLDSQNIGSLVNGEPLQCFNLVLTTEIEK